MNAEHEARMNDVVWIAGIGALGAAVNAWVSDNSIPMPVVIKRAGVRIMRPGLIVSVLVGAMAAAAVLAPVAMSASLSGVVPLVPAAIAISVLSARCLSNEVDKRLLRAAVKYAATSPAAHPDTIEAMTSASPYALFTIAHEKLPVPRTPR